MTTTSVRRLLLTGGGGMVGRNLLEHPAAARWEIDAPARSELDLFDFEAVRRYIAAHQPDIVVHAAGLVGGIAANLRHPVDYLVKNTDIGRNIVLGAAEAQIPRLLNLASSCMYPRDRDDPLTEDQILKGELEPTNEGYAIAKVFATRLCEYVTRENPALQYKTLIPCNLYGKHDKFDAERAHLVAAVIAKIHRAKVEGAATVEIWGDGTARREFLFAGDFAGAVFHMLENFDSLPAHCNIGVGLDHSIDEYYACVANAVGWRGRFVHNRQRPVGMSRKLVDVSKQAAMGWSPTTSLPAGIAATYGYFLQRGDS